ncbi:MAG TPA: TIGR03016 family PEP-CTERM system-associated outer membrane protein [Stellaceae bacterium]|nr:TIGR03016 family PEP-CTERM system-associated outer membrane protein [Stellaceae bacterium]
MRHTRSLAVLFGAAAFIGAVSPATAQLSLGPLDNNGDGPIPPVYAQGLRQNVDRPLAPNDVEQGDKLPPKGPPLWQVIPRAQITEEITDNVRDAQTGRQADLITTFTPGVYIAADAPRLTANLDYSPSFQKYAVAGDQDNISNNLFGTAIATLVPDTLGFETRGAIFQSAHTGTFGGVPTSQLTNNQRTDTYTAEASPVLRHSFDTIGDGELRYIVGETWFGGQTGATTNSTPTAFNGFGTTQPISNALHNELRATLDTGGVGKYVSNRVTLDGQRNDVDGGIGSNKESLATDEVTLHLRNNFALVGSGGWQTLEFAQVPSQNYNGPTWYAGMIYEPNADSQISLNYGLRDGAKSFQGDMRYTITPLITAYASYAEVTTTPQQAILQNLNGAVLGPNGSVLNASTGLPESLNNNLSLQNDVERLRTFQGSLVYALEPNRFALTGTHQETNSLTGLVPNDSISGGIFTWDRKLSPLNDLTLNVGYSAEDSGHTNTFSTSLAFRHAFSQTLFGEVDYSFVDVSSVAGGTNFLRNSLIFTLRKVF